MADESPNDAIDSAIAKMMKRVTKPAKDDPPVDVADAIKVINSAIAWEKVKHQINDDKGGFDPSEL